MRIHCDLCGAEFDSEDAIEIELDDGEIAYFCSQACVEKSEYHETMHDPGPDAQGASPDVR